MSIADWFLSPTCGTQPSRKEFDDYLRWVAGHFNHVTRYSSWVQSVLPVKEDDQVVALDVTVNDTLTGNIQVVRTQNLAIAIGGEPAMPVACASPNVFHSSQLLEKLPEYDESKRYRERVPHFEQHQRFTDQPTGARVRHAVLAV